MGSSSWWVGLVDTRVDMLDDLAPAYSPGALVGAGMP
jgi:hypothetical protein